MTIDIDSVKNALLQHLHTLPIAVARHRALPQVKAVPIVLPSGKQVFAGPIWPSAAAHVRKVLELVLDHPV